MFNSTFPISYFWRKLLNKSVSDLKSSKKEGVGRIISRVATNRMLRSSKTLKRSIRVATKKN